MAKTIIKELIIVLLLCLAIILLLGILLYEYVPMTKTIQSPVSYTTPDSVKEELANAETIDENQIIMTYEVDSTDLNNYKKIQDYKPGKANPFSSYDTTTTTGNTQTGTTSTTSDSEISSGETLQENTTSKDTTTSGGQFFQDKGTK